MRTGGVHAIDLADNVFHMNVVKSLGVKIGRIGSGVATEGLGIVTTGRGCRIDGIDLCASNVIHAQTRRSVDPVGPPGMLVGPSGGGSPKILLADFKDRFCLE